ncbi:hypothetical protein AA0X95_23095 [Bacillus sp. 1P10SD]|uniref:hypothetical protein n=1 Tax=Bacillus sp. 1P10SD TaxID=3132265 RepID=UPI0039A4E7FE
MDKAIIFGIYDFVSFHTSQTLLNQGIEVVGITFEDKDEIPFYEEKRLEVGRNANFSEQSFSKWEKERELEKSKTVLVFSIYDLYMMNKETRFLKKSVMKPIVNYIEKNNKNIEIVCLLPIQELGSSNERQLGSFLEQISRIAESMHVFYLPAIYGPWQPETFLFQQSILSKIQRIEIQKGDREWTKDILFVCDAVESIFELVASEKSGKYVLQSGKKEYWSKCASYLQIDESLSIQDVSEPVKIENQMVTVPVRHITPIADSITQQVEHVRRLYQGNL